jgi:hypothetical protein
VSGAKYAGDNFLGNDWVWYFLFAGNIRNLCGLNFVLSSVWSEWHLFKKFNIVVCVF